MAMLTPAPLFLARVPSQSGMELFLRTSGAGQSWLSPAVFLKLARTPRVWKAACQTGEGVQGAGWPLPMTLALMVRQTLERMWRVERTAGAVQRAEEGMEFDRLPAQGESFVVDRLLCVPE